eukprot:Nitzschia sp. Nitz4//scaffold422_size12231//9619//11778//NITZ4_008998-RA/size12231-processed-gene-0.6-mRNA-1//-1//CDS//3329551581//2313//frame0
MRDLWITARERDRRKAQFQLRERLKENHVATDDDDPTEKGCSAKKEKHDVSIVIKPLSLENLHLLIPKFNSGNRSFFSAKILDQHFDLLSGLVPTDVLLPTIPVDQTVSRLGEPYLGLFRAYYQYMDSVSLLEHSILLGRYYITASLLAGGIYPCQRGRIGSTEKFNREGDSAIGEEVEEHELLHFSKPIMRRFLDCFPKSLSSYIVKRVVDMRFQSFLHDTKEREMTRFKETTAPSSFECSLCRRQMSKRFRLVYSASVPTLVNQKSRESAVCGCHFCEMCFWNDMIEHVSERRGDVVQCPCCSSPPNPRRNHPDSSNTDPHEVRRRSKDLFDDLPIDSIALKQSGRKRQVFPELQSLTCSWEQGTLPSLGLCQSVRQDKLFTYVQKNSLPFVEGTLAAGVDIQASNEYGQTPLYIAVSQGNVRMVELLLAHGADPWTQAHGGSTLDSLATAMGHGKCLEVVEQYRRGHWPRDNEEAPLGLRCSQSPLEIADPQLQILIHPQQDHPGAGSFLISNCIRDVEPLRELWSRLPVEETRKGKTIPCSDRSYFCDCEGYLQTMIQTCIHQAMTRASFSDSSSCDPTTIGFEHSTTAEEIIVLPQMRFLHYHTAGSSLAPHLDLTRVHDATGQRSTHTFLFYLTNCLRGGATSLLEDVTGPGREVTLANVHPVQSSLLLFPHVTPHEGQAVVEGEWKLLVRGEVILPLSFVGRNMNDDHEDNR